MVFHLLGKFDKAALLEGCVSRSSDRHHDRPQGPFAVCPGHAHPFAVSVD